MKIESSQISTFGKIALPSSEERQKSKPKEAQQEQLHSGAFVELKKINQQIATLQSLGISFSNIQKELGELQELKSKITQNSPTQEFYKKLQNLQNRLDPLLREARHLQDFSSPSKIALHDLDEAYEKLEEVQEQIKSKTQSLEEKITTLFKTTESVDLQDKMLKDPCFKVAHNTKKLSSAFSDLIA